MITTLKKIQHRRHVMHHEDIKRQLSRFLAEDIGRKDITSALLPKRIVTAKIMAREPALVAGTGHAKEIFGIKNCTSRILKMDGTRVEANQDIMRITGDASDLLSCERTALNLLARMSGIATHTREMVDMLPDGVELYATRKTAPGLREFDKQAVVIGGGKRHRLRLDESVMIKDNHIAVTAMGREAESLEDLIKRARHKYDTLEVEVESAHDALLAARSGATTIMLDNLAPAQIRVAVRTLIKAGLRDGVHLEASGGITKRNIASYARTGVDMISVGSITSSVVNIDMSLEILRSGR